MKKYIFFEKKYKGGPYEKNYIFQKNIRGDHKKKFKICKNYMEEPYEKIYIFQKIYKGGPYEKS